MLEEAVDTTLDTQFLKGLGVSGRVSMDFEKWKYRVLSCKSEMLLMRGDINVLPAVSISCKHHISSSINSPLAHRTYPAIQSQKQS
jgi:hypothetical protein